MNKDHSLFTRAPTSRIFLLLIFTLLGLITLVVLFHWSHMSKTEAYIVDQIKIHNMTLARSGSYSIQNFFYDRISEIELLTEVGAIQSLTEKEGISAMQALIGHLEEKGGLFGDLVRVDKDGKPVWSVNAAGQREADQVSLADRDYFIWARDEAQPGEVYLSGPVKFRGGVTPDQWGVILAAPVYIQDEFNGLVFLSFLLQKLNDNYVLPLAYSPDVRLALVNEEGMILASTIPGRINRSLKESLAVLGPSENMVFEQIIAGDEAKAVIKARPEDRVIKMIIASSPIKINGNQWSLIAAYPLSEAMKIIQPFYQDLVFSLSFILIGVIALFLIFVLGIRVIEKRAFLNGFHNGRTAKKK